MPQFAEIFKTCHGERRASPGAAGISASPRPPSAPLFARLGWKSKHPENLTFAMQLQGILFHKFFLESCCDNKSRCFGRTPCHDMVKETFSGWIRLALALPHRGIVRAALTMTGRKLPFSN
jgi:hypothetical protein